MVVLHLRVADDVVVGLVDEPLDTLVLEVAGGEFGERVRVEFEYERSATFCFFVFVYYLIL
jgi:hypothetical protein